MAVQGARQGPAIARRQVVLFVVAIVAPSILLVAMAFRMATQERELADKRRSDEQLRHTDAIRQALVGYLERAKLQAVAVDRGRGPARSGAAAGVPVALLARLVGDRLVLPWDDRSADSDLAQPTGDGQFDAEVRAGERDELIEKQPDRAAGHFRRAVAYATAPAHNAYARLLLARALTKGPQPGAAQREYAQLLALSSDVADEHGIPIWCYAGQRLVRLSSDMPHGASNLVEQILEKAERQQAETPWAAPAARHLVRELTAEIAAREPSTAAGARAASLSSRLDQWAREGEQAEALQRAFPLQGLRPDDSAGPRWRDAAWILYGDPPWLVSLVTAAGDANVSLVAVDARAALHALTAESRSGEFPGVVRLLTASARDGEWLGDGFPGVKVAYAVSDSGDLSRTSRLQAWFTWTIVFLVLSVTASGGYFLWRDVRRELRLAALRAQFVSSVSHELKTPLTAIRMFAETLRMGRAADQTSAAEYLDTIVNESERLTRLLNNVLEFSKMERGTAHFRLTRQSIADPVQTAVRALSYPLAQQGFTLNVDVAEALPLVAVDGDAIEQAVLNLLTNAMKYSGESRAIDLRVRCDGGRVVIDVVDRGIGIPPHEQAHIFEKFYRVATPENQHIPGTGLGLTLVDHIARAHAGSVRVTSASGQGSTFSMLLPAPQSAVEAESAVASRVLSPGDIST